MKNLVFYKSNAHSFSFTGIDTQDPRLMIIEFSAIGKRFHSHKAVDGVPDQTRIDFYLRNYVFELVPCLVFNCQHQLKTNGLATQNILEFRRI